MKVTWKRLFWNDDDGAILAEALIVIPLITIFAVGILEFGNVFWQRHLLELGVKDAARYWARCRPVSNSAAFMPCSQEIAKNIALYGNPGGDGPLRVPGWKDEPNSVTFTLPEPPTDPTEETTVLVTGSMNYLPSPLFGFIGIDGVGISFSHEQRYYGW